MRRTPGSITRNASTILYTGRLEILSPERVSPVSLNESIASSDNGSSDDGSRAENTDTDDDGLNDCVSVTSDENDNLQDFVSTCSVGSRPLERTKIYNYVKNRKFAWDNEDNLHDFVSFVNDETRPKQQTLTKDKNQKHNNNSHTLTSFSSGDGKHDRETYINANTKHMTPNGIDDNHYNSLLSSRTADKYQAHTFLKDFKKKSDSDNKINLSIASSINLSSDSNSLIPVSELVVPFSDRNEDRVELDMGNGIKLLTPFRYSNDLRRFTTIKWEMRDRNMNLYTNKFNDDKKFSSDIFKIISRENREGRENKTLYKFPFSQAMSNNSIFKVPVDGNNMSTDLSTDTKFVVAFSVGVGNECCWKEAEAKLEDKFFIFPCYQMSSFCIRSEPKQISQNIQPCGLTIKTGTDGKMIMQFPPTCVEQNRDITYQIFRPAITSVKKSLPEWKPKLLIAVSDKICMKFTRNSLKTPIYLSFPLPENLRTPGVEPRLIGFRDHRPFIIRMVSKKVNDEILYEVKGCDGAALAVVQVGTHLDTNILKTELDIFYGSRILCKIILFAKTTNEGSSDLGQLFALCVIQAEVDDTIENSILRRGFRCIYITDALCLNPLQRIRIQVSGGILSLTCDGLPVTNHFLTFLCESKENAIEFPVSVVKSGIPYAIVKFLLDNMSRGTVSEVHFEPYLPFKSFYKRTRGYAEHSM